MRRLYSGKRGAVGQVTGVERPDVLKLEKLEMILKGMIERKKVDLLARQPALPRLRSLLPASREARLADSLNKFVFILRIWRACCINKQSVNVIILAY